MASAFLSSILSKTSQVLGCVHRWAVLPSSSSDPRSSVLKDLEKLERTLKRIQAVLHDAEEREIQDESVKLWLKELKEVAYEADDVLDEYQYEVLRAQVEGRASRNAKRVEGDDEEEGDEYQYEVLQAQVEGRASRKRKRVEEDDEEEVGGSLSAMVVSIPDGMGDRIREIRERFDEISQDRERLHLRDEDGGRRVLEDPYPAPTSHMVDESTIYGRKGDKQKVIDLLFSEGVENGVSVIPIVGKGGLGKTTIAQLVYNDSKVKEYFNLTGWVCVSNDFDVPRLTKAILESLTRSSCDLEQLSTLQDTLKKKLKGKRVLLVLDDVWNEQQSRWESLRNPFVGAETVRIIMTCRNDSVAEIMQTVRPYHPRCLSPEQSWTLFRHYAFSGRDPEEQPSLADMGKQIVEKCSGLPLALKSIGSLLRYTADEDSWMDVIQSDIWEADEKNEILPALRLSYSRMPAHLKPCFIYCSMFPKDYEFDKDELVRLWMAQGYIQTSGGRRRMEDIGDEYFIDLQRRSFFDSDWFKFKMHDMIHDLAKSIAGNECQAIVDKKLRSLSDEVRLDKVRHLYVEDEEEFVKSLHSYNFSALRTLLLWNSTVLLAKRNHCARIIPEIIKNLPLLRTLQVCWEWEDEIPGLLGNLKHLRHVRIQSHYIEKVPESVCLLYHLLILVLDCRQLVELPDGLGNLTSLRYFRLRTYRIKRLPGTICQLRNLQMLFLDGCADLQELPSDIESLTSLCHLYCQNTGILYLPAGIGKLAKLQNLLGCYKVQGGIGVLKERGQNLETLIISGLRNVVNIQDARDAGLKHKHKLKALMLAWNAVYCNCDPYHPGVDEGSLLHLEAFPEENKDVPVDEKREEAMLEYLEPHASLKKLLINGYGGSKFPEWVGNLFSFASLQEIIIIDCKKIRSLPLYIHDSLGKLDAPISKFMLERVHISGCQQLTSFLLSEEGLPSNLQDLHIEKCQQLTSLPRMQNLTSLGALTIKNCPQLRLLSEEGLPSNLQDLHIEECQELTSLPRMQNLISLGALTIRNCPQLRLLSEEGLPSNLQDLHIEECQQLTSFTEIQNLTSLRRLIIQNCPKLHITTEDQLSSMPNEVKIVDCPGLSNWCQIQRIECIEVASGNKLTISNTWENIMSGFDNLTSVEYLYFGNCWRFHMSSGRIAILEEVTIWGCTDIPPLWYLRTLPSLRSLVIKDCPRIDCLRSSMLPSTLKSLVVDSCEGLKNLLLELYDQYAFEELQLVNCPKLERVEGLNCLFFPKILRIERCPQLQLPQDD